MRCMITQMATIEIRSLHKLCYCYCRQLATCRANLNLSQIKRLVLFTGNSANFCCGRNESDCGKMMLRITGPSDIQMSFWEPTMSGIVRESAAGIEGGIKGNKLTCDSPSGDSYKR